MNDLIDGIQEMLNVEGFGNMIVISGFTFLVLAGGAYVGVTPNRTADWLAGMFSGSSAA